MKIKQKHKVMLQNWMPFPLKICKILSCKLPIVLLFILMFASNSFAQEKKITLKLTNKQLAYVLNEIEVKSGYSFLVRTSDVDLKQQVSIVVENKSINEILNVLFKDKGIVYEINDKNISIYIKQSKTSDKKEATPANTKIRKRISGLIIDAETKETIIGANIIIEGESNGTISDINGKFSLEIAGENPSIKVSYIGYDSKVLKVNDEFTKIELSSSLKTLDEVVVVGYGQQKKESVVGAITNTTSKELERAGGVTNLAQALTGQLPGLTTIQTSGQPGKEDPAIYIRGQSTWNGGQPYILVDGVERRMNDIDISEVESVSVLKDASATAVFGVKGANGVILITTKRGKLGKPVLSVSANSTLKYPTKLVDKLDAYDTFYLRNRSIEREMSVTSNSWADYMPVDIIWRYRNQDKLKYPEAYPNVNWQDEIYKDNTIDNRINLNISGGTNFAKYFSSLSYTHQGDLMKIPSVNYGKGYEPGFGYDKFNFRTNLDLNLTPTTTLNFNMAGVYGIVKSNALSVSMDYYLIGAYTTPPSSFLPQYEDGTWGYSPSGNISETNTPAYLANKGYDLSKSTDLTTDLAINQKLDFITKGLSASFRLSFDNHFESVQSYSGVGYQQKYIDPAIEDMPANGNINNYIFYKNVTGKNQFPYIPSPWTLEDENAENSPYNGNPLDKLRRRLYYQGQLNYAREFGKSNVAATGVFTREQLATGSEFPRFREDWIFRTTYSYDLKYFAEFNGAYNGSEKFGSDYRFAFFPSSAIGWNLSNEKWFKNMDWIDKLKLRFSYGLIGDDGGLNERWLYQSQWDYKGRISLGDTYNSNRPYTIYTESVVGNPDIHWEVAKKSNFGFEFALFKNLISTNIELFSEDRSDILLTGISRVSMPYLGLPASTANVGRVKKNGYEIEVKVNKTFGKLSLWLNSSLTHAVDKIIEREEPQLKDDHLKQTGFQIGQTRTIVTEGFINNWDQLYISAPTFSSDVNRLPGDYFLMDFNGDGVVNGLDDAVPYGYSNRPQNNYNFSFGANYKGVSFMMQFYGVNNVSREVISPSLNQNMNTAYKRAQDFWWKDNQDANSYLPSWRRTIMSIGQYYIYDGSFLRLKTAEVAYSIPAKLLKNTSITSLRFFANGNNLIFWSDLPDEREGGSDRYGSYPTSKRFNFGLDIKF